MSANSRGMFSAFAVRILAMAATSCSLLLIARIGGVSAFGVYAVALATVSILLLPIQGGVTPVLVRETARSLANRNWDEVWPLWKWCTTRAISGAAVSGATVVLAIHFLAKEGFVEEEISMAVSLAMLALPVCANSESMAAMIRGMQLPVQGILAEQVAKPVGQVLLLASILAVCNRAGPIEIVATFVVASFGASLWNWRKRNSIARTNIPVSNLPEAHPSRERRREWRSAAYRLSGIAILQAVTTQAPILLTAALVAPDESGLFRVAAAVAAILLVGMQAANLMTSPRIALAYHSGNFGQLQASLRAAALLACSVAIPGFLVLLIAGKKLIPVVLGEGFSGAYPIAAILGAGQLVNAFFGPAGIVLTMTGHEKRYFQSLLISGLSSVCLLLVLVPRAGGVGAALAVSIGTTIANAGYWISARKALGADASFLSVLYVRRAK
jgi:O-antigen/teichoic acid export membrane protein